MVPDVGKNLVPDTVESRRRIRDSQTEFAMSSLQKLD